MDVPTYVPTLLMYLLHYLCTCYTTNVPVILLLHYLCTCYTTYVPVTLLMYLFNTNVPITLLTYLYKLYLLYSLVPLIPLVLPVSLCTCYNPCMNYTRFTQGVQQVLAAQKVPGTSYHVGTICTSGTTGTNGIKGTRGVHLNVD